MKSKISINLQKYRNKRAKIRQFLRKDFKNYVEKKAFNGKEKTFLIGDKQPLTNFSELVKPLFNKKFELIPSFVLNKAAIIGSSLSENLEYWNWSGLEPEIEAEKEKIVFDNVKEFLKVNRLDIFCVEKYFINLDYCFSGYIDLICLDQHKQFVAIEIKTRNDKNLEIDNITRAQAFFYKISCHNIKTLILVVSKESKNTWKMETLNFKVGLKHFNTIKTYWNLANTSILSNRNKEMV